MLASPCSTLLPYTTLFRSRLDDRETLGVEGATPVDAPALPDSPEGRDPPITGIGRHHVQMREQDQWTGATLPGESRVRSEEHTSELQSMTNLECRLLLTKK